MQCSACGKDVDASGTFPGGKVRCACGAEVEVPVRARPSAVPPDGGGYRQAEARPSEAGMLTCPFCGGPCADSARACPHCDVQLASVRCPSCFALHFTGSHFCARCGKELQLEPLLDATSAPCPRCNEPLSIASGGAPEDLVGGAMIHECVKCGGIFLDDRSLERIVALRRHAEHAVSVAVHVPSAAGPHAMDPVRYVKCPLCRGIMNRVNFGKRSGVIVDVCKGHGTWFDAGELTRAIEFVAAGGLEETERREVEAARQHKADPAVARSAADLQVALTREAVDEGRRVGWWAGRTSSSWGDHHESLVDVLLDLLR